MLCVILCALMLKLNLVALTLFSISSHADAVVSRDHSYETCVSKGQEISNQVDAYFLAALTNNTGLTTRIWERIQTSLAHESDPSCAHTLNEIYVNRAIEMFLPDSSTQFGPSDLRNDLGWNGFVLPMIEAFKKLGGKVEILDAPARADLGGKWHEKDSSTEEYTAIGGYDCSERALFIDSSLNPLDIQIQASHELVHLFHDQDSWRIQERTPTFWDQMDWNTYNLMDEYSATVASFSLQMFYEHDLINRDDKLSGLISNHASPCLPYETRLFPKCRAFQVEGGFTLFAQNGLMANFFNSVSHPKKYSDAQFSTYSESLMGAPSQTQLQKLGILYSKKEMEQIRSMKREILNQLSSVYFLDSDDAQSDYEAYLEKLNQLPGLFTSYVNGGGTDEILARLSHVGEGPSPACRSYRSFVNTGKISHYLGTQFGASISLGLIRPCLRTHRKI